MTEKEYLPSELAPYERPATAQRIAPIVWSIDKYEVAQLLATTRMTMQEVSSQTGVPLSAIQRWKQHPEFQEYMRNIVMQTAEIMKAHRLQILYKILDARVDAAERIGNYAALSTKDTLEILDALRKETEKEENKEQSNYLKTIEALIKKSGSEPQLLPPEPSP